MDRGMGETGTEWVGGGEHGSAARPPPQGFPPNCPLAILSASNPSLRPSVQSMSDRIATLVQGRRERISRLLGRPLAQPLADDSPLSPESRKYLLDDAIDLYWNELEWEHLTEEESVDEGEPLIELMFPGLLAFVRGLLLTRVNPDSLAPAEPRPVVVEDLLAFLARRVLELDDALAVDRREDQGRLGGELKVTSRLVDLVLYQFHGLTPEDIHLVETAGTG